MRNSLTTIFLAAAIGSALAIGTRAQGRQPVPTAEYGQWETLVTVQNYGGLSPDGRWLAYGINRSNRNNELRVTNVADGATKVAAFGTQPVFSADSRWVGYAIGYSESQEEKLRKDKKPIHRKLGLLNLGTGETSVVDGIESFAFGPSGGYVAMRRYPPERKEGSEATASNEVEETPGSTLIVRQLATGRDTTFGSIAEFAWQDSGATARLLAMTVNTEDKTGNGVQIFDPESGALRVLDSSSSVYSGLAWRKDAGDLAVLRAKSDRDHDGPTQVLLAWRGIGSAAETRHVYDPVDRALPSGLRTVAYRKPTWAADGRVVFVGLAPWLPAIPPATRSASNADGAAVDPPNDEEPAGVDVWHGRDVDVLPKQKVSAKSDRQRNHLAAWHVDESRVVRLGREFTEQVTPVKRRPFAYAETWGPYAMARSIGRPSADLYLIDLGTGARTKVKDQVEDRYAQVSPGGRYVLFFQDDHYWTIDTDTRAVVNITKSVAATFTNRQSDATIKQKPPHGVAGWLKGDEAVVLYDQFDLWQVAPDGSRATRLTDGAAEQVRHRYVRLDPDEEWIDPAKPMYLSLHGLWTKKSGYARLRLGTPTAGGEDHLVWLDRGVDRLAKAKDADVYAYVTQAFDDSPDTFVGGPELRDVKPVTTTNPFQAQYAWGRSELVEYKSERGERLQGALFYPANYERGKRYPMIVYVYERLSDQLHRYSSPSERDAYNTGAFTSLGYFVLKPDIVFRPREPGVSVAECVVPAVKRVLQMGDVDPRRVGITGHSWGGFDTTFLVTHADVFAAGVAGAPITNLVSNYGDHHWTSGIAETDHIETGQQRMEVPLWEDLPAYIRNSALFGVHNMKAPLLIEVGDADGTVQWHQGVELYNAARRANKDVVLLVYAGEDHGLRKKANQLDYHRRIVEWFGHYLKGEPAPRWITSGVTFLEREQELRRLKARRPTS